MSLSEVVFAFEISLKKIQFVEMIEVSCTMFELQLDVEIGVVLPRDGPFVLELNVKILHHWPEAETRSAQSNTFKQCKVENIILFTQKSSVSTYSLLVTSTLTKSVPFLNIKFQFSMTSILLGKCNIFWRELLVPDRSPTPPSFLKICKIHKIDLLVSKMTVSLCQSQSEGQPHLLALIAKGKRAGILRWG